MAGKVKEKPFVSRKAKEKIQAAPKELLRRGLLTGTEKLKGQLRDAAEGGRREDTEADRVQDTARMGVHLAVDKLGRLALRKKKVRSWSGGAAPGTGKPQTGPNAPTPGTQAEPSAPHGSTEPVRIKTRDAVHDVLTAEYDRAGLPGSEKPMVKTKDVYLCRQAVDQRRTGRQTEATPQPGEYIHTGQPSQPVIRAKDNDARQYGSVPEQSSRRVTFEQVSEGSLAYSPQGVGAGQADVCAGTGASNEGAAGTESGHGKCCSQNVRVVRRRRAVSGAIQVYLRHSRFQWKSCAGNSRWR